MVDRIFSDLISFLMIRWSIAIPVAVLGALAGDWQVRQIWYLGATVSSQLFQNPQ